jgi:transposase
LRRAASKDVIEEVSKDHRPDLRQMILAVLIDGDGHPSPYSAKPTLAVCSEMWPGNTADVKTLVPVIERLRRRFAIGRVCVIADRGNDQCRGGG